MPKSPSPKTERDRLAFAKLGMEALIDEATGYQEKRFEEKNALRRRFLELGGDPAIVEMMDVAIAESIGKLSGK